MCCSSGMVCMYIYGVPVGRGFVDCARCGTSEGGERGGHASAGLAWLCNYSCGSMCVCALATEVRWHGMAWHVRSMWAMYIVAVWMLCTEYVWMDGCTPAPCAGCVCECAGLARRDALGGQLYLYLPYCAAQRGRRSAGPAGTARHCQPGQAGPARTSTQPNMRPPSLHAASARGLF